MLTTDSIEEYKKHLRSIDMVLISHPDVAHLGALPYLFGKCGLSCPIYTTVPVHGMGLMFMYDLCESRLSMGYMNDLFSLDDVDAVFDYITQLKYCQSVRPAGGRADIVITPLPAGHMLGGTVWSVVKDADEHILYAVDFNHKPERHLNMCSFVGEVGKASAASLSSGKQRPALMITDPGKVRRTQPHCQPSQTRRLHHRDEQLLKTICDRMSGRDCGDCVVCADSAGRILELLIVLDQAWPGLKRRIASEQQTTGGAENSHSPHLVYLSYVGCTVIEFARSMVEWMNDHLCSMFEQSRLNPYRLQHFTICHSLDELTCLHGPKVILSNSTDLECGLARQVFLNNCHNPNFTFIMTVRPSPGTLGARLFESMSYVCSDGPGGLMRCNLETINVDICRRVRLEGDELHAAIKRLSIIEELDGVDPVDADCGTTKASHVPHLDQPTDTGPSEHVTTDEFGGSLVSPDGKRSNSQGRDLNAPDVFPSSDLSFTNTAINIHSSFPYREVSIKCDEYGEIVSPEEFMLPPSMTEGHDNIRDSVLAEANRFALPRFCAEEGVFQMMNKRHSCKDFCDNALYSQTVDKQRSFDLNAHVVYIDFEGRSETESIRRIVKEQRPRNLIVVHGTDTSSDYLLQLCRSHFNDGCCVSPTIGEVVDVTQEKNMVQVYLDGEFASSLKMSRSKDHCVCWVTGQLSRESRLKAPMACSTPSSNNHQKVDNRLVVKPLSKPEHAELPNREVVFINDPKLSDLKVALCEHGVKAEFLGGTLMCDNVVAIKRNETGKIIFEGTLCETYFKVREILYSFYAII